ncbi:2-polyprenylphenol hydroxylase [hydrothermal vent metagenome]|uniref:2-polyprenylphenol hydroxylase n=1 Tax=hydrothermal vent metagenome TaxID=652676 RepID=A0A3B0YIH3_9ZZZZ
MTNNPETDFDIVISGAGLVGLALAAALGRDGFSVALLEARLPVQDWKAGSIDLRVYAISRASQRLFESLGVWSAIEPLAQPYRDMRVWDAGSEGEVHFDSAELGEPDLGHIIESRVIERALLEAVENRDTVTRFCPASLREFKAVDGRQRIELESGESLTTQLLVGADGKQSRVRDLAGIHVQVSDYGQQALVAVIATEKPHCETAWQRFLSSGPLAFLPLHDGRCSIVWSATSDKARALLALDDEAFCHSLGNAFDHRLGEITGCGERVLFPLQGQSAASYVQPGLALVGDAAHVIHPLAGQGVNLGLKDVQALADTLHVAQEQGRNIGAFSVLRRFERARRGDNMLTQATMGGFKQLFGSTLAPVRFARGLGLKLFDRATPIKTHLIRTAMGL